MGRTIATFTQLVYEFERKWTPFVRALRKEDQEAFAELVALAHYHAAAISYAHASNPFESFMLAMLIGLVKRLEQLERAPRASEMTVDAVIVEREGVAGAEVEGERCNKP